MIPADYRQFLLNWNGGYFTEPDILPPSDASDECPVDCLTFMHGIGAKIPEAEFASEADLAIFDDNDPPQVIPIGATMMGNLILLITHPENNGWIVLKKAFSEKSFFLAEGIEDFFGLLHEPSDE